MPTDKEVADAARAFYAARVKAYETTKKDDWLEVGRLKRALYEVLERATKVGGDQ